MKNEEIKIRISEGKKSKWQNVATNRDITLTQLIMDAMENFLEGVPTYYDTSVPTEVVPTEEEEFKSYFKGGKK